MRFSWEHLVAICLGVVALLLAWFSPTWFHLEGLNRAILSIGIIVIGAAAIAGLLLWARSNQLARPAASVKAPAVPGVAIAAPAIAGSGLAPEDINALIREAQTKVSSARLGHGSKLASLRVIFLLGDASSGKTTAVLHSGLDAELIAGQVFQEGNIVPTPSANFWFARKTVLVEAGPNLLAEARLWQRMVQRLTSGGLGSIFSSKAAGERIAVVCFDCEKLVKATSPDAIVGMARTLRARLEEMSQAVGASFPVYVLFTRADRLPFFDDFVGAMTNDESTQILGVTLPIATDSPTAVYAERETKRLTIAFNSLFFSLADHRPGLLSRERNKEKQPGVYEFPREFRKLAKPAVQFLVDLCRPSQLRTGPFLRGFYFTGTRMVASSTASVGSQTMMQTKTSFMSAPAPAANATTMLSAADAAAAMKGWQSTPQVPTAAPSKVSQPVFVSHIFGQILLQDHGAHGVSGGNTKANFWRRALLATAAAIAFIWICGLTISFFSNRALESDLVRSAQAIHVSDASAPTPASLDALLQLDALRQSMQELTGYERNGAPFHLRWGLYVGHDFYAEARRVYFLRFRQLLFGQIQASMLDTLRRLPATPGPNDDYGQNYDALKAYLITTSDSDKSTPDFLSPVLQRFYTAGQDQDSKIPGLARLQFDFYAKELKFGNPYETPVDPMARNHARDYLNNFGAVPRIYTAMQNAASKPNPSLNFYQAHLGADDVIRAVPEVPGAFTKGGWDFMQNAITHSDQYFRGEEWVLGGASEAIANRADLETQLRAMYLADYIKHWQDFLKTARVAPYASVEDAGKKLKKLSANDSALLALFCDASQNTAGRSPDVDKAFKSVQEVVPAPCENKYISPITQPYVAGLAKLENCLEGVATAPPEQKDAQRQMCNMSANEAKLVVATQIVPALDVDPVGHMDQTVRALLEQPINIPGPGPLTGTGAKGLCDAFAPIMAKYPFNPNYDAPDASVQDFDAFFKPGDGALSKFILANQAVLVTQGTQYALKPGVKVDWTPTFLPFLNKAHFLQQSFYAAGSGPALYRFTVRATLPEGGGISGVTFTLNGQTLKYPGTSAVGSFTWPGSGLQQAKISYRAGGGQDTDLLTTEGPWAILRLTSIPDAKLTDSGTVLSAEWHPLQADRRTPLTLSGTGKPIIVHLDFDAGGTDFVFQEVNFSGLACRVAR
jgi:type VI secretion system protein ImpL